MDTQNRITGTATRVHKATAKKLFDEGCTIAVSERGHEPTFDVYRYTSSHTRDTATWEWLTDQVDTWRNRYPNQRYYVVAYTEDYLLSNTTGVA